MLWQLYKNLKRTGFGVIVAAMITTGVSFALSPTWTWNVFISLDQFANTLLMGDPDETISSRLGKWKVIDPVRGYVATVICGFLDIIDFNHCENSIEDDEGKDAPVR
jgi:hypothetical protein